MMSSNIFMLVDSQRMVAPLKRFLPSRLYERILRSALGL